MSSPHLGTIAAHDPATGTLTTAAALQYPLSAAGGQFRLLNNAKHIRNDHEFGWRAADGRLVVRPANPTTFEADGVRVARLSRLFDLVGCAGVTIRGFVFADALWSGSAINLDGCTGCRIVNNTFRAVGNAVRLNASPSNWVEENTIEHTGRHGIDLNSGSNANSVRYNTLRHIGVVTKYVHAIGAQGVNDNVIAHNDIRHSARYGISIKDWLAPNPNFRNRIEHNRVVDTLLETADGGAIEMLGRSKTASDTVIRGNHVEGCRGVGTNASGAYIENFKGFGIYLDDKTSSVTVSHNFIIGASWASVYVHGGDNNVVTNNVAVCASETEDFIRIEWMGSAGGDAGRPVNTQVAKNVIYCTTPVTTYWTILSSVGHVWGANQVYNSQPFYPGPQPIDAVGDPLFTNRAGGDYSLQATSPAFAIGITDLDWARIGIDTPLSAAPVPPAAPATPPERQPKPPLLDPPEIIEAPRPDAEPVNEPGTILLLNGSGSTIIDDAKTRGRALMLRGGVKLSHSHPRFGRQTLLFNAALGGHLEAVHEDGYNLGAGDFTAEGWVLPSAVDRAMPILSTLAVDGAGPSGWALTLGAAGPGRFAFTGGAGGAALASAAVALAGVWQHVAVTRAGGTLRLFLNGRLVASAAGWAHSLVNGQPLAVGAYGPGHPDAALFDGAMIGLRVVKGRALHTADFAVPLTPPAETDGTVFLLTLEGGRVENASGRLASKTVATVGAVALSAARARPNGAAIELAGGGLWLPDSNDWDVGQGDFCLEAIVRIDRWSTGGATIASNEGGWNCVIEPSGRIVMHASQTPLVATPGGGHITLGRTHHLAVSRARDTCSMHLDGVRLQRATADLALTKTDAGLLIGRIARADGGRDLIGKLYGFRLTNGANRGYDAAEIPALSSFPVRG
ncbi:hypothetical protein [Azospirillum argentinense]|uniref:LamG-like jellyroll fold domain-containing protein n=1 Tax=Azospirillum argentinense TaxID=2970906 RepID=UPI0032DF9197